MLFIHIISFNPHKFIWDMNFLFYRWESWLCEVTYIVQYHGAHFLSYINYLYILVSLLWMGSSLRARSIPCSAMITCSRLMVGNKSPICWKVSEFTRFAPDCFALFFGGFYLIGYIASIWASQVGTSGGEPTFTNSGGIRGLIPGFGRSPERAWQPTPVFLPGESHGKRSLAGFSP